MTDVAKVVAELAKAIPDDVQKFHARKGDRVLVEVDGILAAGTIGDMQGYYGRRSKVLHSFPVILDGTGQVVDVPAEYLKGSE